eukprot:symbB.v1.2.016617.t1/scaffold1200.1/size132039/7
MSQAVVIRNTFLEVGGEDAQVFDHFRRQVSEPVKMFSTQQDQEEDTDEDFGPKVSGGLRAVWETQVNINDLRNCSVKIWLLWGIILRWAIGPSKTRCLSVQLFQPFLFGP